MMQDVSFFLKLERQVWQALTEGDAQAEHDSLSADFLGVYATGYGGRDGNVAALVNGPTVQSYTLSDPRLIRLGPGMALLAYRADYVRSGGDVTEVMYVSSIWRRETDGWVNIFSQDTELGSRSPV